MLYYTAEELKKYLAAACENAEKAEKSGDMFEWHLLCVFRNSILYRAAKRGNTRA